MTRVLFFDLDGTLSNTHDLARATWLEVLRPHGIDVDFEFYQQRIRGRTNDEIMAAILPRLSEDERQRLSATRLSSYQDRVRRAAPLPGLPQFMDAARERGYRIALVTNAPRENSYQSLNPLGLSSAFDPMVFADEAGAHKPDPAPYNSALQQLDLAPGLGIAFEDSPTGVTSATRAGIPVIALVTTHHPRELREAGAALVVGDFADPALYEVLDRPEILFPESRASF